jgi:diguanylate cyclase (GGDEF)-like protein
VNQTDGSDFSSLARGALRYLRSKFGFDLWMISRTEGERSIVLEAMGESYGVTQYASFNWADSFSARMAKGDAPRIVPNLSAAPAYALTGISHQVAIGAYIGVPLTYPDGEIFGTLCAFDPRPQPSAIEAELPLVEMIAKMLSDVLAAELRAVDAERIKERAQIDAETDSLTGLLNQRGWERRLQVEEQRCQRYANPAYVVRVDLDGLTGINSSLGHEAGNKLLRRTAKVIRKNVRELDTVARVGGDEFAILGTPCGPAVAQQIVKRVRKALERAGVRASLGMASRVPALHLGELWTEADQLMFGEKTARKLSNTAGKLLRISRSQTFPLECAYSSETDKG